MRNILVGTENIIYVLIIHLGINYIYTQMCVQKGIFYVCMSSMYQKRLILHLYSNKISAKRRLDAKCMTNI